MKPFILIYLTSLACLFQAKVAIAQEFPRAITLFANDADSLVNDIINTISIQNGQYTPGKIDSISRILKEKYNTLEKNTRQAIAYQIILGDLELKSARNNEAFPYFASAVELAEKLPNNDPIYGLANGQMGAYLNYYDVHELSISYLKKSLNSISELNTSTSFYESSLLDQIILSYYALGIPDSAFHYQNIELEISKKRSPPDLIGNVHNNIGIYFQDNEYHHEAIEMFDEGRSFLNLEKEPQLLTYVNIGESKAHSLITINQFQEAIDLLIEAYEVRKDRGYYDWSIQALNYILEYYTAAGQQAKALVIAEKERPYFQSQHKLNSRTAPLYKTMGEIYQANGKGNLASAFLNTYYQFSSKKLSEENKQLTNRRNLNEFMDMRIQSYEQGLEIEKLAKEKLNERIRRLVSLAILISLLSVSVIALFYIIARNKRKSRDQKIITSERQRKLLLLENQNLEYEIKLKERDIRRIAADNKVRTATKMELLDKLYHIQTLPSHKIEKELFLLTREFDQSLDNENEMSFVQDNISEINASFEKNLSEKIPGLSRQEMKIANLIKIGMNNQQIASMINKADSTVRSYKFRMKKKAGLANARMLEDLIKSL